METKQEEKKNYAKRDSYALAFKMIDDALKHGCPLQAITIEESILTDRLSSTLNVGKEITKPCDSLGDALNKWKPRNPRTSPDPNARLFDEEITTLFPKLDSWRRERNALLHGLAKSAQGGKPEIEAAKFLIRAVQAANDGLHLVEKVKRWSAKQIRKAKKGGIK